MELSASSTAVRRWLAAALWSGATFITLILLWRRAAGALTERATPLGACVCVAAACLATVAAAALIRRSLRLDPLRIAAAAAATLLPPLVLAAVVAPAHGVAIAALTVLLLVAGGMLVLILTAANRAASAASISEVESPPDGARSDAPRHNPHVLQWMTRSATDEGGEVIEGAVHARFEPGQRHAVVHLAFSPPLCGTPEIECEPLDDAQVESRVAAAYCYGARIELRREAATGECATEIGFTAAASRDATEAA